MIFPERRFRNATTPTVWVSFEPNLFFFIETSIYFERFVHTNWMLAHLELDTMHRTCVTFRHSVVSQGQYQS